MFIIKEKLTNICIACGNNITYLDNGYPRIDETNTAYDISAVDVVEYNGDLPENFIFQTTKYCYMDNEFYSNPLYKEPYTLSETEYWNIKSDVDYLMLINDSIDE